MRKKESYPLIAATAVAALLSSTALAACSGPRAECIGSQVQTPRPYEGSSDGTKGIIVTIPSALGEQIVGLVVSFTDPGGNWRHSAPITPDTLQAADNQIDLQIQSKPVSFRISEVVDIGVAQTTPLTSGNVDFDPSSTASAETWAIVAATGGVQPSGWQPGALSPSCSTQSATP